MASPPRDGLPGSTHRHLLIAGCIVLAYAVSAPGYESVTDAAAQPPPQTDRLPDAGELIDALGLEGHVEGGFFRRTYEATDTPRVDAGKGARFSMTSIFYLLTAEGPIGHLHRNESDIVHYFHLGDAIEYFLIHPDGRLETVMMGPDPTRGQQLQLTVRGGTWKASRLSEGSAGYGLISEAVSPGFDYADMTLGRTSELLERFPEHAGLIRQLSREEAP